MPTPDDLAAALQRVTELEKENERFREALKWYARCDIAAKAVWDGLRCRMEHDDGTRARAALKMA